MSASECEGIPLRYLALRSELRSVVRFARGLDIDSPHSSE